MGGLIKLRLTRRVLPVGCLKQCKLIAYGLRIWGLKATHPLPHYHGVVAAAGSDWTSCVDDV